VTTILEGQTFRVTAIAAFSLTVHTGQRYGVGAASRGHDAHAQLQVGDVLVVAKDSTPNGDTLTTMACGCLLLLTSPG